MNPATAPLSTERCYCDRLDLPHVHTLGDCARVPRPQRRSK